MTLDLMEQGERPMVYESTVGHSDELGRRVYDEEASAEDRRAVAAARSGGLGVGKLLAFPGNAGGPRFGSSKRP